MDPAVTAPDEVWPPLPFPAGIEGVEPCALRAFFAFHQLVDTYLGELQGRFAGIQSALAAADTDQVRKGAHALRSSSFLLGLDDLGNACRALETAEGAPDAAAAAQLPSLVDAAARRLLDWKSVHPEAVA